MELFAHLNRKGRTIVAVLHDLNHAARYADHIIAMRAGHIAEGAPSRGRHQFQFGVLTFPIS